MKFHIAALATAFSALAAMTAAGPAKADPPWERGHHKEWKHHKRHDHYWDGPRVVYAAPPRVVYAPPPRVVYAPPPVVYAAPPVVYEPASPSINFVFPLR